jgi:RHS repeat-associated protein
VDQNPDGDGQYFAYNLRFPGQYYDAESGLNYNYFRDYDPAVGRYVESDPIGLNGASYSLYAYANGNPINVADPLGLYGVAASAGFHLPISPGVAVGPAVSSSIDNYSNDPRLDLTYNGVVTEVEAGVIVDAGVSIGINDISNTGGKCEGATFTLGLGRRSGISITLRSSQDTSRSILNPLRYIDGFSLGLGVGIALPVSASIPVTKPYF